MAGASELIRSKRLNAQSVNFLFHHVVQGLVDHLVALNEVFALEMRRDDSDGKMPAAAFGAFMPGMLVAVITHLDFLRRQNFTQAIFDERRTFHGLYSRQNLVKGFDAYACVDAGFEIGIGVNPGLGIFE